MFLGQKTRIFLIGNNIGERSIIERVFADAESSKFKTMRIPAIIDEKSAWPAKYALEEIDKEKDNFRTLGKLDIWMKEKMCEAISEETRTFHKEDIMHYDPALISDLSKKCNIFIAVDLAISEKQTADFTAIPVVGVNSDNHWFILDCIYGRFDPSTTIDHIFNLVRRWNPIIVGIEKVAFQRALIHFVMKEMPARNTFFCIKELEAEKQKELRIKALQPRFKTKTIWLPQQASWLGEMETELLRFPKGLHDDLIDALAYIETFSYPANKAMLRRQGFAGAGINLEFAISGSTKPEDLLKI
jgi:predicted phage terminase large subunit-like protein